MELILLLMVIGLIPAVIAAKKGRNFFLWWLYGMALWIIALIHSILLKSPAQRAQEAMLLRGGVSSADELERFAKLKEQGLITEAEFAAKKRAILGT